MPKDTIDYSNTIIYKIFCNDKTINDVYVGHTTNFTNRKHSHKRACCNLDNKLKIYNTIRQNGGWDNWNMVEIAKYNCSDNTEARIKEQQHYEELNSNLNSCPPYSKKYDCSICNTGSISKKMYEIHINSVKHKKKQAGEIKIVPKKCYDIDSNFYCNFCQYGTGKKSSYDNHLLSQKHSKRTMETKLETGGNQLCQNYAPLKYTCDKCPKEFKNRSGLWKHKQKCNETNNLVNETVDKDQLILMLIKQNSELIKETTGIKNMMLEVIKNGTHNHSNNNTNSLNKTFNLQFFLNETCKDAMNIMDFVETIKVQLCDLEKVGQIGYVEGISNIIVKNLNSLDETKRPVHCTDAKREVLYVKDEDKWEKENKDKQKLRKVIKEVAYKNSKMLKEYKSKHPDCDKSESKFSDQYNKLIIEAMGGKGDNDLEKEDKIIKNIAKEVTIDK
jgi:hypothetical protein